MKLPAICLCLTVVALAHHASTVSKRDLATIAGVLDTVQASLEKLQVALKAGPENVEALLSTSNGLIAALRTGTTKVNATSSIDFLDSVRLIRPVHDLSALAESLTSSLEDTRGPIKKAGLCDVTRIQLSSISAGSRDLIKAVNGKIPVEAREISDQVTSGLSQALVQAQDQFSEQNCKVAATAGPSSSQSVSVFQEQSMTVAAVFFLTAVLLVI